jgi:SpoVK/Ycf46/Vps4 family AAA+-type ATPase
VCCALLTLGKTLVARVLASQCSLSSGKKVAFFMRKGADCLSKWVGEAERQLRLLFEQAQKLQPSIIFFDEIDGLAPVRSAKQDQIHSSIVSTLLALMDGLEGRGNVIIIGATNRPDAIDPALRRPGRFDRELAFQLPNNIARRNIIRIHTKAWKNELAEEFLDTIADECIGYCGADVKSLCTEAALNAIKRTYPQIYNSANRLLLNHSKVHLNHSDFYEAMKRITPAAQRNNIHFARPIPATLHPILNHELQAIHAEINKFFPLAAVSKSKQANQNQMIISNDDNDERKVVELLPLRPRCLLHGVQGSGQSHLSSALLQIFEEFPVYCIDLATLCAENSSIEESLTRIISQAIRSAPAILFWPHADLFLSTANQSTINLLNILLNDITANQPLLLLATTETPLRQCSEGLELLQTLFQAELSYNYQCKIPTKPQRTRFFHSFKQLFLSPPPLSTNIDSTNLPQLPIDNAPKPIGEEKKSSSTAFIEPAQEELLLRSLRVFIRGLLDNLIKTFRDFADPIDPLELPDYSSIVVQPTCLFAMVDKNNSSKYPTIRLFLLDIDLLVTNTRQYFGRPMYGSRGIALINRVCHLQDYCLNAVSQFDISIAAKCEEIHTRNTKNKAETKSTSNNGNENHSNPSAEACSTQQQQQEEAAGGIGVEGAAEMEESRSPSVVEIVIDECRLDELIELLIKKTGESSVDDLQLIYFNISRFFYRWQHLTNRNSLLDEVAQYIHTL